MNIPLRLLIRRMMLQEMAELGIEFIIRPHVKPKELTSELFKEIKDPNAGSGLNNPGTDSESDLSSNREQ